MKGINSLYLVMSLCFSVICFSGCRSVPPIKTANGKKPSFDIHIDANTGGISHPVQKSRQQTVAEWMANDCATLLRDAECEARVVKESGKETPPGVYVLDIKIEKYRWRYVGTSLDISYTLTKDGATIFSEKDGCGTSRNWRNACRKLDINILGDIRSNLDPDTVSQ